MRLRANRRPERSAVNAARVFFEDNGCVFQEIEGANDYGKDAYVDIGDGIYVTGTCAALQIKGGRSFRTVAGDYRIPVDEGHRRVWAESTVPILGVVHDPEDGLLRWANISQVLRDQPKAKSILVRSGDVLTAEIIWPRLVESILLGAAGRPAGILAQVLDTDEETSMSAVFDALAVGRRDPRVLVGLRYVLRALGEQPLRAAINVLSHATPHPDIFWDERNWLSNEVKSLLSQHFRWTPDEVIAILDAAPIETFQRGDIGESAYMLLHQDPAARQVVAVAAGTAMRCAQYEVAQSALYLTLYWLGEGAPESLQVFLREFPEAATLPLVSEMRQAISDHGYLTLF